MKKYALLVMAAAIMLSVSGCGSNTVDDQYSFGAKVIQVGNSEVEVSSPFDLGKQENIKANEKGQPDTTYANLDANYLVVVEGIQPSATEPLTTIEQAVADQKAEMLKKIDANATWNTEATTVDGVPAIHSTVTYMSRQATVSLSQYTFINQGVLWNIKYQHAAGNPVAAEISKRVEGHINITKKEG